MDAEATTSPPPDCYALDLQHHGAVQGERWQSGTEMKQFISKALCAVSILYSGSAYATVLNFDITGNGTARFTLDTSIVKPMFVNNTGITYTNVSGTYNGVTASRSVQFFNSTNYGGFNVGFVGQGTGPVLYTGSTADPVFNLGTFQLQPFGFGVKGGYTVTIAAVAAAVPEPATWAMMILGFGLVGYAVRRRAVRYVGVVAR